MLHVDKPGVVAALRAVGLSAIILITSLQDLSAWTKSLASLDSCLREGRPHPVDSLPQGRSRWPEDLGTDRYYVHYI